MVDFPFPEDVGEDPREALADFVVAVRDFLAEFVFSNQDPRGEPLFVEELLAPMRLGFEETMQDFDRLTGRAIEIPEERIREHGLFGSPLRFKFSAVKYRVSQFRSLGGGGLFRWVLDTIEGILDSIIDAAGTGGAIKEIKEAIRNSTKE
jgi:hypothetical protein